MPGAPLDLARTLPEDWTDQVLEYRPAGPAAPLIELVQRIVRDQGELVVGLRRVQDVALWMMRSPEDGDSPALPWLGAVLDRLVEASGSRWRVDVAAKERAASVAGKHVFNLADVIKRLRIAARSTP